VSSLEAKKITPATGTTVTLGAAGDAVEVSATALKTNTIKDAGGNIIFTSDGSGTLSSVNSAFAAGLNFISSQTAVAASSIAFTTGLDSTYNEYVFMFTDIACSTDNKTFQFQCSTDSGSNYNITITSTCFQAYNQEGGSGWFGYRVNGTLEQETTYQPLAEEMGNGSEESSGGILHLLGVASTTYVKHFYSRFSEYAFENKTYDEFVAGYLNTTSAIDAINFKMNSGTFSGTIALYGTG